MLLSFRMINDIPVICRAFPSRPTVEKPSAFAPRGQSDVDPRKLFYFDPSKVLTGGIIFILPCLLLGLYLADAFAKEFDAV